jgi:hypothetical protein
MSKSALNLNKDFFKTFTHDMSYTLGFICADGNLTKNKNDSKFLTVYSKDIQILRSIRECMNSEHKISRRKDNCCRIQIGSKIIFDDLANHGICENKTKRLTLPKIPIKFFPDFIRGYFDGDGNVWMGLIHKERKTQHWTIRVVFTSGTFEFLEDLNKSIFINYDILGVISKGKGNYFRLTYSMNGAD